MIDGQQVLLEPINITRTTTLKEWPALHAQPGQTRVGSTRCLALDDAYPGNVIHQLQSGSIPMITDVAVDPAGNVWGCEQLECHRTGGSGSNESRITVNRLIYRMRPSSVFHPR
jgi:hypothetical protein